MEATQSFDQLLLTNSVPATDSIAEVSEKGKFWKSIKNKFNDIQSHLISTEDTTFEKLIYDYLDTVNTMPLLHWGVIVATGALTGNRRFNMFTAADYLLGKIPYASKIKNNKVTEMLNYLLQITADPNIEGIPIASSKITVNRDVDISESCFIVPDKDTKEYRADNAVPKLREWTVEGYISSIGTFHDYGLVIKPTIVTQMKLLDTYAKSRRPVWFKTSNGTFHRVQIKRVNMSQDPTMMNGVKLDISLKEYIPLTVMTELRASSTAEKTTETEAKTKEPVDGGN